MINVGTSTPDLDLGFDCPAVIGDTVTDLTQRKTRHCRARATHTLQLTVNVAERTIRRIK